jgi:hypothetical protein
MFCVIIDITSFCCSYHSVHGRWRRWFGYDGQHAHASTAIIDTAEGAEMNSLLNADSLRIENVDAKWWLS